MLLNSLYIRTGQNNCETPKQNMQKKKKKSKTAKWLSEEALKIAVKRREVKRKGERNDISI